MGREKAIKELRDVRRYLEDKEWSDRGASPHIDAINDVLAFLKEQESHLMTAEEVQNVDLWDFCYLEEKRLPGNEYRTACGEYKLFCATWPRITQAKQEHGMENYGKTWRCWTAGNATRPSSYDRKHTAWD